MRSVTLVLLFGVVGWAAPIPQDASRATRPQPFGTAVTAVVVDVVVRDGKGNPVPDLQKTDFELLEDGVRQEIGDVTITGTPPAQHGGAEGTVVRSGLSPSSDRLPSVPAGSGSGPRFMALVFDRLSADARLLAYNGALASVDTLDADDYVAVFVADLSLHTIQTYTNDRERIRQALRDAATRATSQFDSDATRDVLESNERGDRALGDSRPSTPVVASAEFIGRPVDARRQPAPDVTVLHVATGATWDAMASDQQGYATTNALIAVTAGLGTLPGRKSVVFFAEGLAIPDAVLPHFRHVVTTANRGNVSVYTIDAAGLRVHSKDAETSREVRSMGAAGLAVSADGSNLSSLRNLERNEDVLRKDPRTSLTLLARETGGFLVENTNDLASAFRRIDADRRFHYLLTYTPKNSDFDGKWRTLSVRVPDRQVSVRARSGYLAVRSAGVMPLLAHEGPALAALAVSGRAMAPSDVPVRAAAFAFPGSEQPRVVVLAATDASAMRFDADATSGKYRTDFVILARIVDARGEVVRKGSQPYRLSGPAAQVEQARRGEILFYRNPTLEPGTYTLEVVVHDALASKSGVRRSTFTIPPTKPGAMQISSLVLVHRAERVKPEERDQGNPLYIGDVLIYPNLGEPIRKSQVKALTFVLVAQGRAGAAPRATVEIVRDGRILAQAPTTMPAADASGRIEHIAQVPLAQLSPGRYTLRLTVGDGNGGEVREVAFELID